MRRRMPVFDGDGHVDGHVLETDGERDRYYEGGWARRLAGLTIFPSLDGWSRSVQISEEDANRRYWRTDAKVWGGILDRTGLEGSVLCPTIGLACGLMREIDFATATATACNNWLEAGYTRKDDRLFGVGMTPVENPEGAVAGLKRRRTERRNFAQELRRHAAALGDRIG